MDNKISNQKGFTFVEVLIAIAILAIAVIGLASMSGNAYRGVDSAKKLSVAMNLAESKLEALKAMSYSKLEITGASNDSDSGGIGRTCTSSGAGCSTVYTCTPSTDYPVSLNSVSYTWYWKTQLVDVDGDGSCSSSNDGLKRIDMYVQWRDTFGTRTATLSTLRAE